MLRPALDPFGIQLTDVDPTPDPHLEVVLVGTGWPFEPNVISAPPFSCTRLVANGISLLNGDWLGSPEELASSALYSINVMAGLEPVPVIDNCGSGAPRPADCTYADDVPIEVSLCGATDIDQVRILTERLGCP
jgi:hypothetical protein